MDHVLPIFYVHIITSPHINFIKSDWFTQNIDNWKEINKQKRAYKEAKEKFPFVEVKMCHGWRNGDSMATFLCLMSSHHFWSPLAVFLGETLPSHKASIHLRVQISCHVVNFPPFQVHAKVFSSFIIIKKIWALLTFNAKEMLSSHLKIFAAKCGRCYDRKGSIDCKSEHTFTELI